MSELKLIHQYFTPRNLSYKCKVLLAYLFFDTLTYRTAQNFGGESFGRFGTVKKLVEKNLVADYTNSSLFELFAKFGG